MDPVTHRLVAVVHTHHPTPCRYEDYPSDLLMALVVDFNKTSGLTAFDRWSKRPAEGDSEPVPRPTVSAALEVFMAAPIEDQIDLVLNAQGY